MSVSEQPLTQTKRVSFLTESREPRTWTLHYRKGSIITQKAFVFDGSMQEAVIRARKHCEILNYRFIFVRPLLVDLDHQETQYISGKYTDEDLL